MATLDPSVYSYLTANELCMLQEVSFAARATIRNFAWNPLLGIDFWTVLGHQEFPAVLVNKLAKADVDFDSSRILDPENWDDASDHRALLVVFE